MDNKPDGVEPLLRSIEDAARILGISRSTIYQLIDTGKLQKAKIGRRILVTSASIDAYLAEVIAPC